MRYPTLLLIILTLNFNLSADAHQGNDDHGISGMNDLGPMIRHVELPHLLVQPVYGAGTSGPYLAAGDGMQLVNSSEPWEKPYAGLIWTNSITGHSFPSVPDPVPWQYQLIDAHFLTRFTTPGRTYDYPHNWYSGGWFEVDPLIDGYSGTVKIEWICIRDDKVYHTTSAHWNFSPQACNSCKTGDCKIDAKIGSIDVSIPLGAAAYGGSPSALLFKSETLQNLGVPNLAFTGQFGSNGSIINRNNDVISSVVTGNSVATIVPSPTAEDSNKFEIQFSYVIDPRPTPSSSIFKRIALGLENGAFRITETTDLKVTIREFSKPAANTWVLEEAGLRRTSKITQSETADTRVIRHRVEEKNPANDWVVTSMEDVSEKKFSWGWETIRRVVDPDGSALVSEWDYYTSNPTIPASNPSRQASGRLKFETLPTGNTKTYQYLDYDPFYPAYSQVDIVTEAYGADPVGKQTRTHRGPNFVTGASETLTEIWLLGNLISKKAISVLGATRRERDFPILTGPTLQTETEITSSYSGTSTKTKKPDGTVHLVRKTRPNNDQMVEVVMEGLLAPYSPYYEDFLLDGTSTETVTNSEGIVLKVTRTRVKNGQSFQIEERRTILSDHHGRPERIDIFLGNALSPSYSETKSYSCCGLAEERERDGITSYHFYDALERRRKTTRNGIAIETVRNGLTTHEHRYAESIPNSLSAAAPSNEISRTVRNLAGDVTEEWTRSPKDGTLIASITATTHLAQTQPTPSLPAGIASRVVTTYPLADGESLPPSSQQDFYLDGTLAENSGNMNPAQRYTYGADDDGQLETQSYVDTDGSLRETIVTRKDGLGNTSSTSQSAGTTAPAAITNYLYNSLGQLASVTDPDGIVTLYGYDSLGQRTITAIDLNKDSIINAADDRVNQKISEIAHRDGILVERTITSISDSEGTGILATQQTDTSLDGLKSWTTEFPSDVNPVTSNNVITYDATPGSWTILRKQRDATESLEFYISARLDREEVRDSEGLLLYTISYGYDLLNRLETIHDTRSQPITRTYVASTTDVIQSVGTSPDRTTVYQHDQRGRVRSTDAPDTLDATGITLANITTSVYFPNGNLQETDGAQVYRTSYTYDYAERISTLTTYGSQAATTRWRYDPASGYLEQKLYNSSTQNTGTGPSYTYTAAGRLKSRVLARGLTTQYEYHPDHGELDGILYQDPLTPDVTILSRDRVGRIKTLVDAAGTRAFEWTNKGDLDEILIAGNGALTGLSLDYSPDSLGRPSGIKAKNGQTVVQAVDYHYNPSGHLSKVTANGLDAQYRYDSIHQKVDQIGIASEGNAAAMLYHTRVYDALGRLETIASHNGKDAPHFAAYSSTTYQSNALDQRTEAKGLDKNTWDYGYNPRGEVVTAVQKNPSGAPLGGRSLGYTFDGIGNRTSAKFGGDEAGENQRSFGYTPNALNQYSSLTHTPSLFVTGTAQPSDSVTVNGELASRQAAYFWKELTAPVSASAQSIAVNVASNDLTHSGSFTFPPQFFTPTYDLDGNLLADSLFTYTWNEENQLIRRDSVLSNQPTVSNSYDARGRCISQTETLNGQAATTLYLYDGWNVIAEFTTLPGNTGSKILTKTMTWGNDLSGTFQGAGGVGGLLSSRFYDTPILGATNQIYCYDGNGNVSSLVNPLNMRVSARYNYGPFGELLRSTGEMAELNEYRFSTKPQDKLTGLYYYGFRWYDPRTGRWLSRDPIGERGGVNLYGFVGNDGVSFVDVLGFGKAECLASIAAAWNYAHEFLTPELAKYDPVEDAKGGHPKALSKGGGLTKPYGHLKEIKDFQQGLKNRLGDVVKACKDDCPPPNGGLHAPYPRALERLANRRIPRINLLGNLVGGPVSNKTPLALPAIGPNAYQYVISMPSTALGAGGLTGLAGTGLVITGTGFAALPGGATAASTVAPVLIPAFAP